jgi:hypothetical protein
VGPVRKTIDRLENVEHLRVGCRPLEDELGIAEVTSVLPELWDAEPGYRVDLHQVRI